MPDSQRLARLARQGKPHRKRPESQETCQEAGYETRHEAGQHGAAPLLTRGRPRAPRPDLPFRVSLRLFFGRYLGRYLGLAIALMLPATPAAAQTILERVLAGLGEARPLTAIFVNNAENIGADGLAPRIDGSILLRVSNRIDTIASTPTAIRAATLPQLATGNLSTTAIGATNTGDVFTQFRLQAGFHPPRPDTGVDPDPDPGRVSDANGLLDLGSGAVMTGLNATIDHAATASAGVIRRRSGPMGVDLQAVMLLANAAANTGDIAGSITIVLGGVDGRIAASDADPGIRVPHGGLPQGLAALLGQFETTALGSINTGMIVSGVNGRVATMIGDIAGSR